MTLPQFERELRRIVGKKLIGISLSRRISCSTGKLQYEEVYVHIREAGTKRCELAYAPNSFEKMLKLLEAKYGVPTS